MKRKTILLGEYCFTGKNIELFKGGLDVGQQYGKASQNTKL